ncbi:MAG: hypothetical protein ABIK47_00600 [candidate division WOR-3 bacterium]
MKAGYQPDKVLIEQFNLLEEKIDAALGLIQRLKEEKRRLEERLSEEEKLRGEAVRMLNTIIDKIETLL